MKKILLKNLGIIIPHGSALRLLTDSFPIKKMQENFNIVVICDNELITKRIRNFCLENKFILKGINCQKNNNYSIFKRLLRNVRAFVYPKEFFNVTLDDFWKVFKDEHSKEKIKSNIQNIIYILSCKYFLARKIFSNIECFFTDTKFEESIIKNFMLTHILTTSFSGVDFNDQMILACRRKKINSITFIQSWDNPSGNGFNLCKPDKILSYSYSMNRQLENFQEANSKQIITVGAIQYSRWKSYARKSNNFNKKKLKILYGGKSYKRFPYDFIYVKEVINCFQDLGKEIELTVRPHPLALKKTNNGKYVHQEVYKLLEVINKYNFVKIDLEDVSGERLITYEKSNSFNEMRDRLLEFDIVINIFSTLALESCVLNIPCLNIYYETNEYKYAKYPTRLNMCQDERQFHNRQLYKAVPNINSYSSFKKEIKNLIDYSDIYDKERIKASEIILGDLKNSERNFLEAINF